MGREGRGDESEGRGGGHLGGRRGKGDLRGELIGQGPEDLSLGGS